MAMLTQASPCMPIMPRLSGCDAGRPPMPSSVAATGMLPRSANARSAFSAPEIVTPWPARITGRFAALNQLGGAREIGRARAPAFRGARGARGAAASQSNSHDACCASLVMSISTGPGRPSCAIWNASRTAAATSCARG